MDRSVGVTEALCEGVPDWTLEGFVGLSMLGDLILIVPVLGLVYLADVGRTLRQNNREGPLCSDRTVALIATVFGGLALVVLLKGIFTFPRPPRNCT